jgi:hypothetical protein
MISFPIFRVFVPLIVVGKQRALDLAFSKHLLPQVVLIFSNSTIPPSDGLVLTHHNIFGNLIKKPKRGNELATGLFTLS